jgi:putative endonuclease
MRWSARLEAFWRRFFPRRTLSQRGERAAAWYLRRRGYRIITRNARWKGGEIDIIALRRGTLVFVEVRTRQSDDPVRPAATVDPRKQRRVARAAMSFLRHYGTSDQPARMDVIGVTWPPGRWRPRIEHIPNAFEAPGRDGLYS